MIIPKGTRLELVLEPGESTHITLVWVETDKDWQCYTTLPGVNNWGRVPTLDAADTCHILSLFHATYGYYRNSDKATQATYRAELRKLATNQ